MNLKLIIFGGYTYTVDAGIQVLTCLNAASC